MKSSAVLIEKRRFWQQHVLQAQSHHGSIADYAKHHRLNANTLYYWVSAAKRTTSINKPDVEQVSFSAVQVSSPTAAGHYLLQLSPRVTLHLPALPDPHWLTILCRKMDDCA
jgi:transposase-like protein